MTIFHSTPTLLLMLAAVILTVCGARLKKGRVLSFFGGLFGAAAIVADLVDGGSLRECLLLALALLLASIALRRPGGEGTA